MSLLDKFEEAAVKRDQLLELGTNPTQVRMERMINCLLYTSDAADE